MSHNKTSTQEEYTPPVSFEKYSKDAQQILLRGLAQHVGELGMPKLSIIQEMFAKAGLTVMTTTEAKQLMK